MKPDLGEKLEIKEKEEEKRNSQTTQKTNSKSNVEVCKNEIPKFCKASDWMKPQLKCYSFQQFPEVTGRSPAYISDVSGPNNFEIFIMF